MVEEWAASRVTVKGVNSRDGFQNRAGRPDNAGNFRPKAAFTASSHEKIRNDARPTDDEIRIGPLTGGKAEIMIEGIEGKVVVITGASSGLGEATARRLSSEGAKVVLGARRADRLKGLANELGAEAGNAIAVTTDVTDQNQVKALVDAAVQKYGRVDVMLNNAGVMPQSLLEQLKVAEWDQMIDVNIKGVLYGIAAVLPVMKQQKSGHIINVSSVAGHRVGPGSSVYAATKFAGRAISEGLRQEVKPYNMRTTIISPGAVVTELPNTITDDAVADRVKKLYETVAISADSFARAVSFAISQPEDVDINEILFRPTKQEY
jgi:NADP-dependent 3-hydroxy acid dehydrogenase YdfG